MAEARKKEKEAEKVILQIGKKLAASKTCPNKSILVELLEQATSAFLKFKQSESLKKSVKSLSDSLIRHGLLDHKDKDVRLLVGICLCEVIRVLLPDPGFSHAVYRDIFRLLLSIFEELNDIDNPYFLRRAKLLERVAKLRFCLAMLDSGCEDLVLKMFKSFFGVVRENHSRGLIDSISSIITSILEEKVEADPNPLERNTSQALLDVILQNIVKGRKGVTSASFRLAVSVIQNCGKKLECRICHFLTSCILNRDAVDSVIKESYQEIILEIYQIAPQLLLSVIPCLTKELLTDQVDVRIKVLNLIRKLLALRGQNFAKDYQHVFIEFLNRFSDKSAEVRLTALSCAKALCMAHPSGKESLETLFAIQGRLLDHDDKVRMEAVNVVCELIKTNLNCTSSDLITKATLRLRDKKVLVRSEALKKLVELYKEYCTRCATGITSFNEHIEEIPSKFLMLCYEKDCQEFRPQSMELVLDDLFPASLSTEERISHWIFIFSHFEPPHLKALKNILSQKRRLRDGLKDYLDLCNREEDDGSGETERKMETLVVKMSSCFPDPTKAKDCFRRLKKFRDNEVFIALQQFLSKGMIVDSDTMKDVYLKELGEQKELSEFFHILYRKCAFNIFDSEHVRYILDLLLRDNAEEKCLENYQQLLLTIISAFPSLLRGSEKQFQLLLLEKKIPFDQQLIEILARERYHMPIKLSDIYSSLEKVCLEGTRVQSKLAVSAIAALADTSEQYIFSGLCKILVDSLCSGENAPTVLQSLGCMAQHSISAFDSQVKVITNYIVDQIFQQNDALASKDLDNFEETSNCCSSCELKVFGLKALVRSFLPHKHACLSRPISFLLDIIQKMLQNCGFSAGNIPFEHDKAFIRLAAAKSVLRLSRKWDLHISPMLFRSTILMAKDHSPGVRRSFTGKVRKLLNNHAVPSRYACAFSFVALDSLEDLRSEALKYLEEFIWEYGKGVQNHETTTMEGKANDPVYLVVSLMHVLAHDPDFPAPDCRDEKIYAKFLSPFFITVEALVNRNLVDGNLHLKSYASLHLRSIFLAIKKAEDAVDAQMTPKLHLLAEVGLSILDSLNTNIVPASHTSALVLLPSSLYRSGSSAGREANSYPLIGSKADASFTKSLVSCLKTHVSGIGGTGTKHSQQFFENSLRPSGTRQRKSTSKSGYTNKLLINKTSEQIFELHKGQKEQFNNSTYEVDTRGRENLAMSLHLGSVVEGNNFSAENKHKTDANKTLGPKPSFPCDSVTKPSVPQNEVIVRPREEDAINKSGSTCAEPSRLLRASDQVNHFTSNWNVESNGQALVGKHIKQSSPIEKCYHSGVVDSFESIEGIHQDLDDLQARHCDHSSNSSANNEAKILHSCAYDSEQENLLKRRDSCTRKVSQAVKKPKRCDDTIGISTSEVIDMSGNHTAQTRRQKV